MSRSSIADLVGAATARKADAEARRDDASSEAKSVLSRAQRAGRVLTGSDHATIEDCDRRRRTALRDLESASGDLRRAQDLQGDEQHAQGLYARTYEMRSGGVGPDQSQPRNPLAYTRAAVDSLQVALDTRSRTHVLASLEERAALTTTTYGQPADWGSNVLGGPRILHVTAGVPRQPVDAVLAEFPTLSLPPATASVGEGVSLPEYASSAGGSVVLGRFGRFTDLTTESQIGTSAGALLAMHQVGIAKDLDKVLIDAVETAAGAAVAFSADVPAAIRKAMAQVLDNTAADTPSSLVILANPADVNLLQDVAPTGGRTMAEAFQQFSGALVYPSSATDAGFMTVANLAAGTRYFEGMSVRSATDEDVKTGVRTVATAMIGGYGITLGSGFAVKIDVVTP